MERADVLVAARTTNVQNQCLVTAASLLRATRLSVSATPERHARPEASKFCLGCDLGDLPRRRLHDSDEADASWQSDEGLSPRCATARVRSRMNGHAEDGVERRPFGLDSPAINHTM